MLAEFYNRTESTFHYGSIKINEFVILLLNELNLHSTMVLLKCPILKAEHCYLFQSTFHYGSIKIENLISYRFQ